MRPPLIALIISTFLINSLGPLPSQAQELNLPKLGVRVGMSPEFNPLILKGIIVHSDNPFKFDFILDKGDYTDKKTDDTDLRLKEESKKLVKYFLSAITTPEKDLWVNLSPYEKQRIIPESFGQTDMGRDLLAQDYMLKQITASLIYPEDEFGKKFWKRVYEEAAKKFGLTTIPVNTFNKVWIVPEQAKVYEHGNGSTSSPQVTAFVVKSRLKVMLEEDYLATSKNTTVETRLIASPYNQTNQIIREIVLPQLEKEINEGKNFTLLRQVYNSLILATWFKKRMKDSVLGHKYMNQNKIMGIDIDDKDSKQKIYEQYIKSFKKGVYNYIKEEQDPMLQQMVPRKYFSGGAQMGEVEKKLDFATMSQAQEAALGTHETMRLSVQLDKAMAARIALDPILIQRVETAIHKARTEQRDPFLAAMSFLPYDALIEDMIRALKGVVKNDCFK